MADTEKDLAALEQEAVAEASANPQADAPKKNAVAAEPTHLKNDAEDLGPAVVKPTDSNPDATKKIKKVSGQAPQAHEGAPDAMPTLKKEDKEETKKTGEIVQEGELPPALKKAIEKKKDEKSAEKTEQDTSKAMDAGEVSKEADKKKEVNQKTANLSAKVEELDVKEHVDALIAGENDLTEEFKSKAATIFESAIRKECKEIAESMEADYNKKLEQESATAKAELTEKVDGYLSYVVEEWMKENEIALERGIKGEIAEDFISGLKKLFAEHYIDVPDEKYNVLEEQSSKIEDLEKKLNEQIAKNVELNKSNSDHKRVEIMAEVAGDLADTQKEKFAKLAEEIEYSDAEDFKKKCETIKESYFGKKTDAEDIDDVAAAGESPSGDLSNAMAAYAAAISKTKDIKLS
jgi:hypothetical protein